MSSKASNPRCKNNFGILLFGPWSSKLPSFECFCMILELSPDSALLSVSSKLPGLQFTAYLHDLGTKSRFSFGILILPKNRMKQMSTKASNPWCKINFGNLIFRILILQTTWFTANLHDFGTKSRFSFGILILQTSPTTLFTVYLHDLGTKSRFSFLILILQTSCFTAYLHDLGTKSRFSFRILIIQKKGWNKCIQMSRKASNPRCKINFGNLTYRILILQTTWFWLFLQDLGTKSRFGFGILILQTTWFTAYLHDFGTKSRFSFGTLILQTTWFTANLHDLGTKSKFRFWILILQKKGWDKCLQKPLIHDAKIILEILTFRTLILQST